MSVPLTRYVGLCKQHLKYWSALRATCSGQKANSHHVWLASSPVQSWPSSWYLRQDNQVTKAAKFSQSTQLMRQCWKCRHSLDNRQVSLICGNCHSLQAIDSTLNYFDLFDLNVDYDLDITQLSNKMKSLQRLTHPDRYSMADQRQYTYSLDNSSLVNKAYKTLRDPYERGLYLLKLMDNAIEENETTGETGIDSKFLSDIMRLNEDMEECESKQSLIAMMTNNQESIGLAINAISDAFRRRNICRAKELLAKYKFFVTLDTNLKQKLELN